MSFRTEKKIYINISNIGKFYEFLNKKKFKEIYPERQINSIYFDNYKFSMYNDSEQGVVPRKKIRIRFYGKYDFKNNKSLETKISSTEGRFKKTELIDNEKYLKFLQQGIVDNTYGICKPKVLIRYSRNYYLVNNFRLTIDKEISYEKAKFDQNYLGSFKLKKNNFIVEIKSSKTDNIEEKILDEFPFISSRISKYCDSINSLNLFN